MKLDDQPIIVTVRHRIGKGFRFKLGVVLLSLGTRLMSSKVRLYANNVEVGELKPK